MIPALTAFIGVCISLSSKIPAASTPAYAKLSLSLSSSPASAFAPSSFYKDCEFEADDDGEKETAVRHMEATLYASTKHVSYFLTLCSNSSILILLTFALNQLGSLSIR